MRVIVVIGVVFVSACKAIPRRIIDTHNVYSAQHEGVFSDARKGSMAVFAPVPSPGNKESRQLDETGKTKTEGNTSQKITTKKEENVTQKSKPTEQPQKKDDVTKKSKETEQPKKKDDVTKKSKETEQPKTKTKLEKKNEVPKKKCDKTTNTECEYYQCKEETVSKDAMTTTKSLLVPFKYQINRNKDSESNVDEIIHKVEKHVPKMLRRGLCSEARNRYLRVDNSPITFAGIDKDLMDGIDSLPLDIKSDSENCTSILKDNECVVVDGSITLFYSDTNMTVNSTEGNMMDEDSLMETTYQLIEKDMKEGTVNLTSEDGSNEANISYIPYQPKEMPENNTGESAPEENEKSFGVAIGTICAMIAVVAGFIGYKIYEKRAESSDYMLGESPIVEAYVVDEVDQKTKSMSR